MVTEPMRPLRPEISTTRLFAGKVCRPMYVVSPGVAPLQMTRMALSETHLRSRPQFPHVGHICLGRTILQAPIKLTLLHYPPFVYLRFFFSDLELRFDNPY